MFFRRSQHPSQAELSAYIDGEIDVASSRRIAAHVSSCAECRETLAGLQETKALMGSLPRAQMPRSFTLSPAQAGVQTARPAVSRPSALRFAPALSLAVLAVLLVVDISTPSTGREQTTASDSHAGVTAKAASESANSTAGGATQGAPGTSGLAPAGVTSGSTPVAAAAVAPPSGAAAVNPQGSPPIPQAQADGAATAPQQPSILSPPEARSATAPTPALVPPAVIAPFSATPAAGVPAVPPQPSTGAANSLAPSTSQPAAVNPVAPAPSQPGDTSVSVASKNEGGGIKLLRVLEILAAAAFAASLLIIFWPRLTRKER